MSLKKMVQSFFTKNQSDSEKIEKEEKQIISSNKSKETMKNIFTKSDLFSLTSFPYEWEKDFFPPLNFKEVNYMRSEILKWYMNYIDLFIDDMIDSISNYIFKNMVAGKDLEIIKVFQQNFIEEFNMMVNDIVHQKYNDIIAESVSSLSEEELIVWKPTKGTNNWIPPKNQFSLIMKKIANTVMTESSEELEQQKKELERLILSQETKKEITTVQDTDYEDYVKFIRLFLNRNKEEIIKNCYSRFLMEYNSFPRYNNLQERMFKNDIYDRYKSSFQVETFNQLMQNVYPKLEVFIKRRGKETIQSWLNIQWDEFTHFIEQECVSLSKQGKLQIESLSFNKYAFALDFFALMLFKINMDGI